MSARSKPWCIAGLVVAWACAQPSPSKSTPVTWAQRDAGAARPPTSFPIVTSAQPPIAPPLVPKSAEEIAAVQQLLQEADRAFFDGNASSALAKYETAWERHHPNPLALVMAAHAAGDAGDAGRKRELLARARAEARLTPMPTPGSGPQVSREPWETGRDGCYLEDAYSARFDGPASAWILGEVTRMRVDVARRRMLYGFCSIATRDAATDRSAAVAWMPGEVTAKWRHPVGSHPSVGEEIDLFDDVYGTPLGSVSHQVTHFDANEEYHGRLAFSSDRSTLASGANGADREVRLWRVADRSLIAAFKLSGAAEILALSDDAKKLAVGTCFALSVHDVARSTTLKIAVPHMGCGYGAGFASSIHGLAFTPDGAQLAVGHQPTGFNVPDKDVGVWVALYRTKDGRLIKRFKAGPSSIRFAPGGKQIASGRIKAFAGTLLDLGGGSVEPLEALPLAFSPDGKWLITRIGVHSLSKGVAQARVPAPWDDSLEAIGPYWIPSDTNSAGGS